MRRSISLPPPLQQLRRCACVSGALLEHPPRVPRHPLNFGNGYQVPIRRSVLRINSNQLQNMSFSQTSQFLWQSDLSTYKRNKIHIHLYYFFGSWSMQSWAQPLFQEKFCTCSVEFTTMSLHTTVLLRHGTRDNMYYGHPHNHNLCSSEQQLKAGRFLLTSLFRCLLGNLGYVPKYWKLGGWMLAADIGCRRHRMRRDNQNAHFMTSPANLAGHSGQFDKINR